MGNLCYLNINAQYLLEKKFCSSNSYYIGNVFCEFLNIRYLTIIYYAIIAYLTESI